MRGKGCSTTFGLFIIPRGAFYYVRGRRRTAREDGSIEEPPVDRSSGG